MPVPVLSFQVGGGWSRDSMEKLEGYPGGLEGQVVWDGGEERRNVDTKNMND